MQYIFETRGGKRFSIGTSAKRELEAKYFLNYIVREETVEIFKVSHRRVSNHLLSSRRTRWADAMSQFDALRRGARGTFGGSEEGSGNSIESCRASQFSQQRVRRSKSTRPVLVIEKSSGSPSLGTSPSCRTRYLIPA